MAFTIDNLIIDRVAMGIAENSAGEVLFTLTQLVDANLEITSESKEARDKDGTLIKKFYTGKSGSFTSNSAVIDINVLAQGAGSAKEVATTTAPIVMPCVRSVKAGNETVTIKGLLADSVKVIGINASGIKVADFTKDTTAGETAYSVSDETVTLPTGAKDVAEFVIVCKRNEVSGAKVANRADEFPKTISLTLKCYAIDPCTPDVQRSVYVKIPSFQPSPDTSLALTTDTQLAFNGDMQVAYCNAEGGKVLYEVYMPEDDNQ